MEISRRVKLPLSLLLVIVVALGGITSGLLFFSGPSEEEQALQEMVSRSLLLSAPVTQRKFSAEEYGETAELLAYTHNTLAVEWQQLDLFIYQRNQLNDILTLKNAENLSYFSDSEASLQQFASAADFAEKSLRHHYEKRVEDFTAKSISSEDHQDLFLAAYESIKEEKLQSLDEHWKIERALGDEVSAYLNLLKETRGQYTIENGAIRYDDQSQADALNAISNRINELVQQERQWWQKQKDRRNELLEAGYKTI